MNVNDGQLHFGVGDKQIFMPPIQTPVVRQELDRGCGQIHNEVRDGRRDRDDGRRGPLCCGITAGYLLLRRNNGCFTSLGGCKNAVGGLVDEDAAVCIEGSDEGGHLDWSA